MYNCRETHLQQDLRKKFINLYLCIWYWVVKKTDTSNYLSVLLHTIPDILQILNNLKYCILQKDIYFPPLLCTWCPTLYWIVFIDLNYDFRDFAVNYKKQIIKKNYILLITDLYAENTWLVCGHILALKLGDHLI